MRICTSCNAQFEDIYEECLHCGRRLTEQTEPTLPTPLEPPSLDEMHLLTRRAAIYVDDLLEALREEGIRFTVIGDLGDRVHTRTGVRHGREPAIEVWVDAAHRERAEAIQTELLRRELPDLPEGYQPSESREGRCPACSAVLIGEPIECPDCGLAFTVS